MIARAPQPVARGLTIIEVLVVCILIALLAGLMLPRLGNIALKRAAVEAQGVAAMLSAAAQRDAMSSQAYAVAFDPQSSKIGLLALRESPDPAQPPAWIPAPWQTPLVLSEVEIRGVAVDGQPIGQIAAGSGSASGGGGGGASIGPWRAEFRPTQPRPRISVLMTSRTLPDERAWQVELSGTQPVARVIELLSAAQWSPGEAEVVDLDAQGMREQPW